MSPPIHSRAAIHARAVEDVLAGRVSLADATCRQGIFSAVALVGDVKREAAERGLPVPHIGPPVRRLMGAELREYEEFLRRRDAARVGLRPRGGGR